MIDRRIDRDSLKAVLKKWSAGEVTCRQVQEFAEAFTDEGELPELPRTDDASIAVEVLLLLDALPALLITPDDIPAFLQFLSTPSGSAASGWAAWDEYWGSVDDDERRKTLAGNPEYMA